MTVKRPPGDLSEAGRRLWRDTLRSYDLNPVELLLLHEAARTADELDRLAKALPGLALTVAGSTGQERGNPLLEEARKHRLSLARLVGQLKEET